MRVLAQIYALCQHRLEHRVVLEALELEPDNIKTLNNRGYSNAKSGQFFFYTHDRQFMIKTQTKAESKYMRSLLPQYYKHVMENPNTFITRFYGMHRVKPHKSDEKHFIIMGSVLNTPLYVHVVYDLKGSSQGRSATEV